MLESEAGMCMGEGREEECAGAGGITFGLSFRPVSVAVARCERHRCQRGRQDLPSQLWRDAQLPCRGVAAPWLGSPGNLG